MIAAEEVGTNVVFEVVDERLVSGENAVMIDIVPVTVWILKGIGAVERVDTEAGRVPGAQALGLPPVGEGIAVGIDEVRVCDGPRFDRLRGCLLYTSPSPRDVP